MSAPRTPRSRDERGHLPADTEPSAKYVSMPERKVHDKVLSTVPFSPSSVFVLCVRVSVAGRGWRVARGRQGTEHPGSEGTRDFYFLVLYVLLLLIYCLFGFYSFLTLCCLHFLA